MIVESHRSNFAVRADSVVKTRPPVAERQRAETLQEDRIRAILGAGRGGRLPRVNDESLRRYYEYLRRHLWLPFQARYHEEADGDKRHVTVSGLIDPARRRTSGEEGILCRARVPEEAILPLVELELDDGSANARLIEDYWYWLWNWH